ncbi:ABC transporter ATP-binding protein [Parahaliea maris]|uniref:ABC transporter ATP-binding protein n=1 Tax=Parahaliea maris TaxID=2716870 RepID=A0A5C9A392_9GAMM|nr:ABC transporter ATP-binding protein [Parahaliea maris]TXS95228.1 ABC transporter ATP-binding protein [Parahaliea maris]
MSRVIEARGLSRRFKQVQAVDGVDLALDAGTVMGLIGPNGAGKTTLLRSLLGLTHCDGDVSVLGLDPRREHARLMEQVCFIADTAVLPRWMTVLQLLDYVSGIHPRFDRGQAERFLASTEVSERRKVSELSKGMTVQLHLALVMAIDARVLILDEPTLGLDILFRKRFYEQLLNDYFDDERTIIISTHQVEEVQNILTEVVFMNRGRTILQKNMGSFETEFSELHVVGEATARAEAIPHIGSRPILGGRAIIYEGVERSLLEPLGEVRTPSVSDLFVAKIAGETQHVQR